MGKTTRIRRKQANRRKEASTAPLAIPEVLDAFPDMLFRMSRDGHYLGFKPAKDFEPFVPPSEFLGKSLYDVVPADVAEDGMRAIEAAISTGETQTFVYGLPLDDGVHQYEARITSLGDDETLVVVRDVTERPVLRPSPPELKRNELLTKREKTVLGLVASGITDKEIGQRLEISPMTVRTHVAAIRKKLGALSRTDASVKALRAGLLG